MRTKLAIAGLTLAGLLVSGLVLAGATEDVSLQYSGDIVSVSNSGDNTVAVTVMRDCTTTESSRPYFWFSKMRFYKVMVEPQGTTRVDRDRSGKCTYAITDAHYIGSVGSAN